MRFVRSVSGTWHVRHPDLDVITDASGRDRVTTACSRIIIRSAEADSWHEIRRRIRGSWHRKWCVECPWREAQ